MAKFTQILSSIIEPITVSGGADQSGGAGGAGGGGRAGSAP